jgi:hypothetical protein
LYKKQMYPNETLSIFLTKGASTRKSFSLMVIIQGLFQYYHKQKMNLNWSKQTI